MGYFRKSLFVFFLLIFNTGISFADGDVFILISPKSKLYITKVQAAHLELAFNYYSQDQSVEKRHPLVSQILYKWAHEMESVDSSDVPLYMHIQDNLFDWLRSALPTLQWRYGMPIQKERIQQPMPDYEG